ncbi:MAG: hypothetical protein O7D32_00035, partial [bacterium]|nr:hypothetical protein [bacterium]
MSKHRCSLLKARIGIAALVTLVQLLTLFVSVVPASAQQPFLEVTLPTQIGLNPALRAPIATYEWQTLPGNPDPVEMRRMMLDTTPFGFGGGDEWLNALDYIRDNPDAPEWTEW